ncbi:MAG: hypothetical protein C0P75_013375 [Bacilli bacterium]|jgi:hypothetical protein|uniref:PRD domain-containing protein n=1 Tax=Ureibacillus suwonensis TaxID=313007 RepID=A0ABW0REM8_9BACL|nr:hypothetical protein [Bacilli bacterium]
MEENHQVELLQCSLNFSTFIHSFAQFLINFFERRHQTQELSDEELLQSETQVIQSLVLIEKLHMLLLLHFYIYRTFISSEAISPFFTDANRELFEKMQMLLQQYPFLLEEHQMISEKTVAQILNYYYIRIYEETNKESDEDESNHVTIILSPLPPPWLANNMHIPRKKEV